MKEHKGFRLLYSCLTMRKQLNKLISSGSLSLGEYLILRNVWLSKSELSSNVRLGTIKAADLSELLERSRPSITRILNGLEKRGLITRTIDPNDRRSINIGLTEAGTEALKLANRKILNFAERVVESLGESDTDKLIALIERLTMIYEKLQDENGGSNNG